MATDYTQTVRRAPFLEAAQENYIDLLTQRYLQSSGSYTSWSWSITI